MYKEIQYGQFTDVLTPVQKTETQSQLWKNFLSNRYNDVDYKNRQDRMGNYETQYDMNGNKQIYERVIKSHPVKITATIETDIDKSQKIMEGVLNPLPATNVEKEVTRTITTNSDKSTNSVDSMMDDIDSELKTKQ